MSNQSINLTQLIDRYIRLIHPWLPIIDARRLKDRLDHCRMLEVADADLANLFLCIHIATHPSSTRIPNSNTLPELYIQAQRAFASSQVMGKFSIGTTQCGLLLALYQLGAGFFSDAYVTLSTTAALARVSRLEKDRQKSKKAKHNIEEQTVWCGIFLLDRYGLFSPPLYIRNSGYSLHCCSLLAWASFPNNLPMLVEQPHSLSELTANLVSNASQHYENQVEVEPYEYFCGEIEASYLAGRALYYLNNPGEFRNLQFEEINSQLTSLLSVFFDKASGSWKPLCGSMAIVVL